MIRQHDVQVLTGEDSEVLAEGTFRIVLTRRGQVITAIDLPDSALGPLHLVFAVSPESMMQSSFATGSLFGDVGHTFDHVGHDMGHGLGKAAEATFNVGSKMATTLARPAFDITRGAAAASASLIAHAPFVPASERKKIEAASRTIMRARLGDMDAQQFIHAVAKAAKDGQKTAQHVGDALIDGTKLVARVLDAPMSLVSKIPKVGGFLHELDPLVKLDHMADKLKVGDFQGIKTMIENDAKAAQGVISLIPGIGTGISAAISVGTGILDGGGALDVAIEAAYGAIPIPAGIRQITDIVLGAVLQLIHNPHNLTDALLAGARNAVPAGMPRDVFDTLANLIVKHMPVTKAAGQLVDSYVQRYAPGVPIQGIGSAAASVADAAMHHQNVTDAVTGAVGDMAKKALPGAVGEGIAGAAHVAGAVAQKRNVASAVSDAAGDVALKMAPGALGEGLSAAAHIAGAAAQGKNVGSAIGDAVGSAARKVAPGALGEGLAGAAQIAGAAAQGKNVAAAMGDVVGGTARKVAPGALGEGLAGAAHIAGALGAGKNAFAAAGDVAGKIAPGVVGQGLAGLANVAGAASSGKNPLLAASPLLVKYLPGGAFPARGPAGAIPLPSPLAAAARLLPAGASAPLMLPPGPSGAVGTALSVASGVAGAAAHGGSPLAALGEVARGLVPAAAGAVANAPTQAAAGAPGTAIAGSVDLTASGSLASSLAALVKS